MATRPQRGSWFRVRRAVCQPPLRHPATITCRRTAGVLPCAYEYTRLMRTRAHCHTPLRINSINTKRVLNGAICRGDWQIARAQSELFEGRQDVLVPFFLGHVQEEGNIGDHSRPWIGFEVRR